MGRSQLLLRPVPVRYDLFPFSYIAQAGLKLIYPRLKLILLSARISGMYHTSSLEICISLLPISGFVRALYITS